MKFNGIDYKQCNNRKQSKSRKKYGKYVVLLPCVFSSRCRQCFQLLTFDIGYGDVGYPIVLQVSMQDTVCVCCGGWGVWRTKTQEKSFWRIPSISSSPIHLHVLYFLSYCRRFIEPVHLRKAHTCILTMGFIYSDQLIKTASIAVHIDSCP